MKSVIFFDLVVILTHRDYDFVALPFFCLEGDVFLFES